MIDWTINTLVTREPFLLVQKSGSIQLIFQGQYLQSLSINYVAINKDMEKLPPTLYHAGAPKENMVQNRLNIALLNVL